MVKIQFLFLLLFLPVLLFAQVEKINFTKKLIYKGIIYYSDTLQMNVYYSNEGILLERIIDSDINYDFIREGNILPLEINPEENQAYYSLNLGQVDSIRFELKQTNKKDTITDYECTYYEVMEQDTEVKMELCIAESTDINLQKFFRNANKVNGFVLKINFDQYNLTLQSIEDNSKLLYLDYTKEVEKAWKERNTIELLYNLQDNK